MVFAKVGARLFFLAGAIAAAGCMGTVVETAGLTPPAAFQQAEAAYQKGDLARAREGFRTFARQYPRDPFTGWALYWQGKIDLKEERLEEAWYSFTKALDLRPEQVLKGPLLLAMGDVEFNRREYKKALADYRKVDSEGLSTTVRQDELYFKLGLALVRMGDRTQAERYFRQIERFPGSPYIEEARRRSGPDAALAPMVQYVLLGKFGRWESAERVKKDAGNAGFQATIERVSSSEGAFYEVRVQVVGSRDDAVRTAEALRGKGFTPKVVP